MKNSYVNRVSRSVLPEPNGISGNAQHGREGSEPTESMCPPWERVIQVLDWRELHKIEDENALKKLQNKFQKIQLN